ncbi:hypothetical protein VUN82_05990 [Micrococcaceae bacterium Sec5.1]
MGGSSSGKHYIYNNTFYCPSRPFLADMLARARSATTSSWHRTAG